MKKRKDFYIDNKLFSEKTIEYIDQCKLATLNNTPNPRISNYLGDCIILLANKIANMPCFMNYSYKDEMISDAIEICVRYFDRFDPEAISARTGNKSAGAFPYFTQICYHAMARRVMIEKKQMYTKQKYISESKDMFIDIQNHDAENFTEELKTMLQEMSGDDYHEYDEKIQEKRQLAKDAIEESVEETIQEEKTSSVVDSVVSFMV